MLEELLDSRRGLRTLSETLAVAWNLRTSAPGILIIASGCRNEEGLPQLEAAPT